MATDILCDIETREPVIFEGDFFMGESDEQNLEDLIEYNPGELKGDPLTGVGIVRMMKGQLDEVRIISATRSQMREDNWIIDDVYLDGQELVAIGSRDE
jgi:hypothetical protein